MDYKRLRHVMVEHQLRARGIRDERVLSAMEHVERHRFVSDSVRHDAYDDGALPIGEGQTISQPYMVALMTELLELKGDERVLEIGTGSGYQAAVLSRLAAEVYTVERIESIAEKARNILKELDCSNVYVIESDGSNGLPEYAPYDGIIVTAAAPDVPDTYVDQLAVGGRLVIPVGSRYSQVLYQVKKTDEGIEKLPSTGCVFVPLIGEHGWGEG